MIISNGAVFCDDGVFRQMDIEAQNGVITRIGHDLPRKGQEVIDAQNDYVVPGLVDIHTHGAMGADFSDGTPEGIEEIARFLLRNGVTSFLGTTMTLPEKHTISICKTARSYINTIYPDQALLRGIYLEGPFFSKESMLEQFNDASGDAVRVIAVAPELCGAFEFIKVASQMCTVSIAHSTANYDIAGKAFSLGANHVTHIFNGMNPFNHREPGIIGAAFDCSAYVELITDGVHIDPSVVRVAFKLFGEDKVCLISDSMRACGLADGQYDLGGQPVTVTGRTATTENNSLAGSVTTLTDCMRRAVEFAIPLTTALKAATINPAKSVGLNDVGSLTVGKRADILVLNQDLSIEHIVLGGIRIPQPQAASFGED
jgi:N-acetylglucosamine-6-phosphate deacetylase